MADAVKNADGTPKFQLRWCPSCLGWGPCKSRRCKNGFVYEPQPKHQCKTCGRPR